MFLQRGEFAMRSVKSEWARFRNGVLSERSSPRSVFERARARGEIELGEPSRFVPGYNGSRVTCFYSCGVVGKNLFYNAVEGSGKRALRMALEFAKRGASVPFFGWRFAFPSRLAFGDFVVELLSREVVGTSCDVPARAPKENAVRFRLVGFLYGSFHRKGVHAGYGESEDRLSNYVVAADGVPWYVDIEPLGDATLFTRSICHPFSFACRVELLRDGIQAMGHLMNDFELRAYCEGYTRGYMDGRQKGNGVESAAEKLFSVLKRARFPESDFRFKREG